MIQLKPCPFCGATPVMYGRKIRDYVDGEWAQESRKEFFISPRCSLNCMFGMAYGRAYGIVGGIKYITEEAAARGWNRRAKEKPEGPEV